MCSGSLKRNVIALYKFACRNHRDADDEFFAFGFSRGAFTIRIVCALILTQGLVSADNEFEMNRKAVAAYRKYRRERFHTIWHIEFIFRALRDLFVTSDPGPTRRVQSIRFLGVWDTVAAYGLPIDEMARGISQWIWPLEIPSHSILRDETTKKLRVERACQALALDEERTTFHPELWNENDPSAPPFDPLERRFVKDEQISQVWFSGVHSNIGGGYPDDSLSYIPFVWMITEARRCGLKFKSDYANDPTNSSVLRADPDTFKNAIAKRDKDGRIYDPRAGLGAYYRYGPRKLVDLCYPLAQKNEGDEIVVDRPKIHFTVFERIKNYAQAYSPVGLPPRYDVVTEAGEILTPDQYGYETILEARFRAEDQEHVWDQIWKRRFVYFTTLAATLWLLIFPFIGSVEPYSEISSPVRWISDLIRAIGAFLPGWLSPWIDGYARAPLTFVIALTIVISRLIWGKTLELRLRDRMAEFWARPARPPSGLPKSRIYRLRSAAIYQWCLRAIKYRLAPFAFAFALIAVGAMIASHLLYNLQDVAGLTCRNSSAATTITKDEKKRTFDFDISNLCQSTGVVLEKGVVYTIKIEPTGEWRDRTSVIPAGGFTKSEPSKGWLRVIHTLALPLRRELFEEWFRIVLRYGPVGGEEAFLEPDPTDPVIQTRFKPTLDGELFMFVNDAVIGVPGLYDYFYRNNSGKATVTVMRR